MSNQTDDIIRELCKLLKCTPDILLEKTQKLLDEIRSSKLSLDEWEESKK